MLVATPDTTEVLQDLILTVFTPTESRNTIRTGLVHLAKLLAAHKWLQDTYLLCLLSLPAELRGEVLDVDGAPLKKCVLGSLSQYYQLSGASAEWDALAVAGSLARYITSRGLENLEESHVDVLWACLREPPATQDWVAVYVELKDYLFVGLCDEEICSSCIAILKHFLATDELLGEIILVSKDSLIKVCYVLVTAANNKKCLGETYKFFRSLFWDFKKPQLQDFVFEVLKSFANKYPEIFERSSFVEIINEIITFRRGEILLEERENFSLKSFQL